MLRIGITSEKLISKTLGSTLASLNVGQSSFEVSVSTSSFTFCLAASTVISSSNSTIIIEKSSCDVEVISITLLTVLSFSSKGSVINFSMSSAVFPGNTEFI